jgi:hypothetical protein
LYRSKAWYALRVDDPRRLASTVRAADCWWSEGQPEAIKARLRDEIEVADLLARWRVRMAGHDVRDSLDDWMAVLDVQRARANGYRPPPRTPRPWTAEDLDPTTWRETP